MAEDTCGLVGGGNMCSFACCPSPRGVLLLSSTEPSVPGAPVLFCLDLSLFFSHHSGCCIYKERGMWLAWLLSEMSYTSSWKRSIFWNKTSWEYQAKSYYGAERAEAGGEQSI